MIAKVKLHQKQLKLLYYITIPYFTTSTFENFYNLAI